MIGVETTLVKFNKGYFMYYTVYKITNQINNKIYIGAHKTSNLEDNYMGSGKHLNYSQNRYGIENFSKEIIFRAISSDIMYWIERMLVDEEFLNDPMTYNKKLGGQGGFDYINSNGLTTKNHDYYAMSKLGSATFKEKLTVDIKFRERYCLNKSIAMKELIRSGIIDHKGFLGKYHTDETKAKMSESHKGKHTGYKNSQFGTMWIHNLDLKESKKIKKDEFPEYESLGWLIGRFKTTSHINKIHKCKYCGDIKCDYPNICNKNQRINTFIKIFGLDISLFGTKYFYREYFKIIEDLKYKYFVLGMSTLDLAVLYNISTQRIDSIFKSLDISHRTKSEARRNKLNKKVN
jgi:hypothetical protein